MAFLFEKLDVYQKAVEFADKLIKLCGKFSRGHYFLSDQLKRAALSVPLNIAEANGRWHAKDRRNFFAIARGSCFECIPILQILRNNDILADAELNTIKKEADDIARMLTGLINKINNDRESIIEN